MEDVLASTILQKVLSSKVDNHLFNLLVENSLSADRAHLLSVSSPHAASWVSVIPSEGLGLQSSTWLSSDGWALTPLAAQCVPCVQRLCLILLVIMHSPASVVVMLFQILIIRSEKELSLIEPIGRTTD